MKRVVRNSAGLFSAALLAFALSACEGDPGPSGPPGTTECFGCHTDDFSMASFILPMKQEYSVSQHALGDTYLRRDAPCSRCHTNEGHQAWLASGVEEDQAFSSKIACFTCHAPHTNGDFSQRRMDAPVAFFVDGVEISSKVYDKGVSNTCASCHQARPAIPAIADGANVTSSRWGPHHAPQANVLVGAGAWEFGGAPFATGPSHGTIVEEGCVTCHMAEPSGDDGGHTFRVEEGGDVSANGCYACHDGWTSDDDATDAVELAQTARQAELDAIQLELFNRGWISTSDPTQIPQTTRQVYANADDLGCIWNFLMLAEDRSVGIHNPVYADEMINATKAYLGLP